MLINKPYFYIQIICNCFNAIFYVILSKFITFRITHKNSWGAAWIQWNSKNFNWGCGY